MRSFLASVSLIFLALQGQSAAACDGKSDVEAAFTKQQKSPAWRTVVVSQGEAGAQEQTFEYIPPDRMHRKIVISGEQAPIETIGIGRWAWSNEGGGWNELQPQFAKMVANHIEQSVATPPKVSTEFTCLGTVSYEGKDYLGYRTIPEKGNDGIELARTIYIDAATGLPAFNIIGAVKNGATPLLKESYTYPTDLVIEKPAG
jgi:hypothetical protein